MRVLLGLLVLLLLVSCSDSGARYARCAEVFRYYRVMTAAVESLQVARDSSSVIDYQRQAQKVGQLIDGYEQGGIGSVRDLESWRDSVSRALTAQRTMLEAWARGDRNETDVEELQKQWSAVDAEGERLYYAYCVR